MTTSPASLGELFRETIRVCVRHRLLFGTAVVVALALQASLEALHSLRYHFVVGLTVIPPLVATVVYVYTPSDDDLPGVIRWERVLERSWAVILIDFVTMVVGGLGVASMVDGTLLGLGLGTLSLLMATILLFADVHAALRSKGDLLSVVPVSMALSLLLCRDRTTFLRALATTIVEILVGIAGAILAEALQDRHVPFSTFWGLAVPDYLAIVPVGVFTTLVYLDAMRRFPYDTQERIGDS